MCASAIVHGIISETERKNNTGNKKYNLVNLQTLCYVANNFTNR
jgi:hypothetical protein